MDLVINPCKLCIKHKHRVLLLWNIFLDKDKYYTVCDSELKFHAHHDKTFLLLKYSIF